MTYLNLEAARVDKEHYFLAQIAAEVRRSFVKEPGRVRLEDFMLTFQPNSNGVTDVEEFETDDKVDSKMKMSKAFWSSVLGVTP